MKSIKLITLFQARAIHEQQLILFGGTTGIIDRGRLESALYRPVNIANYNPEATMCDLAAALGYGITINHPFVDGNKRTAFIVMAVFLEINRIKLIASEGDVVNIMLGIASGTTRTAGGAPTGGAPASSSEEMLCNWLKENTQI